MAILPNIITSGGSGGGGGGGSGTVASGTTNTLAKYTGSTTVGNSTVTDDGTNVTLGLPTIATTIGTTTARQHTIPNVASDTYALLAATQTFTNKTLTAPVLGGTVTGTYTLGGTPTLSSPTINTPTITAPVLSGSATGTYTLAGTPTITAPAISSPVFSGSATGTYTLAGTPTITAPAISSPVFSGTGTGTYVLCVGATAVVGSEVLFARASDSATTATIATLCIGHHSSGTPAASFGCGLAFVPENGSNTAVNIVQLDARYTTVTNASEASYFTISTMTGGTLAESVRVTATKQLLVGTTTAFGTESLNARVTDATTNAVGVTAVLGHASSGTAAAGLGAALQFNVQNGSGTMRAAGRIDGILTTVTDTSEVGVLALCTAAGSSAITEQFRISATATLASTPTGGPFKITSGSTQTGANLHFLLNTSAANLGNYVYSFQHNGNDFFKFLPSSGNASLNFFNPAASSSLLGQWQCDATGFAVVTATNIRHTSDVTLGLGSSSTRLANVWSRQYQGVVQTVTFSATPTFNVASGETMKITMTANITSYTVSAGNAGERCVIFFIQDGTGSRTLSSAPSNVKLSGAITLTTTASAVDLLELVYDGSNWYEVNRKLNLA